MMFRFVLVTCAFSAMMGSPLVTQAQCNQCSQSGCNKCRPNSTRIFIYRSNLVSGGLSPVMGGIPPQGFAVSSVPAMMVTQPALAIHPASFSAFGTAGFTQSELDAAFRRGQASAGAAPAAASAAAGSDKSCPDACGDIKKLQSDVNGMVANMERIVQNLENIDRKLKLHDQLLLQSQQPTPVPTPKN